MKYTGGANAVACVVSNTVAFRPMHSLRYSIQYHILFSMFASMLHGNSTNGYRIRIGSDRNRRWSAPLNHIENIHSRVTLKLAFRIRETEKTLLLCWMRESATIFISRVVHYSRRSVNLYTTFFSFSSSLERDAKCGADNTSTANTFHSNLRRMFSHRNCYVCFTFNF